MVTAVRWFARGLDGLHHRYLDDAPADHGGMLQMSRFRCHEAARLPGNDDRQLLDGAPEDGPPIICTPLELTEE